MRGIKLLTVLGLLFCAGRLPAQTLWTGTSVADAFVTTGSNGSLSGSNFGGAGALIAAAAGLPNGEFQSVLRFDVAGAVSAFDAAYGTGQWTITSLTLTFGTNSGTNGGNPGNPIFNTIADGDFFIEWMEDDGWVEGTGMPNAPTTDGITFDTLSDFLSLNDVSLGTFTWPAGGNGLTTWTLGIPAAVLDDIAAGGLVGFRVAAADSEVSYLFNSRSFGTALNRPVLTITAVPEPATWMQVGLAVFGAMVARRRRREE